MGTFRMYTGGDGQTHVEKIDLAKTPDWTAAQNTTTITFRETPVGRFQDWHPAPRRQYVIILSGQLEIGLGDGSKHVFGPGDARQKRLEVIPGQRIVPQPEGVLVAVVIMPGYPVVVFLHGGSFRTAHAVHSRTVAGTCRRPFAALRNGLYARFHGLWDQLSFRSLHSQSGYSNQGKSRTQITQYPRHRLSGLRRFSQPP